VSPSAEKYVVVLFGSQARGDNDDVSDNDVLVVADERDPNIETSAFGRPEAVHHGWGDMSRMCSYGSLFMLHLKMEGRILAGDYEGRHLYQSLLSALPEYSRVKNDLATFDQALLDSRLALHLGDTDVSFELSNIATICRHASILGCYLLGTPNFGRYSAVERVCRQTRMGTDLADKFPSLYQYRIAFARGLDHVLPGVTRQGALAWCDLVEDLLAEVKSVARHCRVS
jgi:hypothetical protein